MTYHDVVHQGKVVKSAGQVQLEVVALLRQLGTNQRYAEEMARGYAAGGKPGNLLHALLEQEVAGLPPPAAAHPKPSRAAMDAAAQVDPTTPPGSFAMLDVTKPGIDIYGEVLPNGELDFMLRAVVRQTGERGALSGFYMFERMMDFFNAQGIPILAVNGNWTYEANLGMFNRLTRVGLTAEEAAAGTATAEWAHRFGYTVVSDVDTHKCVVGQYTHVTAKFKMPYGA